jgi:hypothetical protein
MRVRPYFKQTNGEYERFGDVLNSTDLLNRIDYEVTINNDEAYELAQSLWMEMMGTVKRKSEDSIYFLY